MLLSLAVGLLASGYVARPAAPSALARVHTRAASRGGVRMAKTVDFDDMSRQKLMEGIDIVANAVKVTLGPKGRNVVLERNYGAPEIVNDGVTIARDIELSDPQQNVGVKLLVEVASKTDLKAGDGTTTSTVLAQAMVREGLKSVAAGASPVALQRGLNKAARQIVKEIYALAKPISGNEDLRAIASISCNSVEMGRIIATAFEKVGALGSTSVEDGQVLSDEIDFTEGMEIDRGYSSPYFVKNQETQSAQLNKPRVLITDRKLTNMGEMVQLLEAIVKLKQPLVIFADDVTGEALSSLVLNKMRGVLDVVAVKAPGFGERRRAYMEDIAVLTGATFVTEQLGLTMEQVTPEMLGTAERIVVGKEVTTIISTGEHSDAVAARIKLIQKQKAETDNQFDIEKCEERVAKLGGAIARIKVRARPARERTRGPPPGRAAGQSAHARSLPSPPARHTAAFARAGGRCDGDGAQGQEAALRGRAQLGQVRARVGRRRGWRRDARVAVRAQGRDHGQADLRRRGRGARRGDRLPRDHLAHQADRAQRRRRRLGGAGDGEGRRVRLWLQRCD
jgi:chaperonin GroL